LRTPRYQITEVTPSLCQAIYETSRNTYIVIGKKVDPKKVGLERKVGENELAVEIPKELLENISKGKGEKWD